MTCIDDPSGTECRGPVEYRSVDPGRSTAVRRCERHFDQRLARREESMEMYEHVVEPPEWFDPSEAGEQW